eukprot:COSAG01_NODE_3158_length_6489_cov_2.264945_7_plen_198_part_00
MRITDHEAACNSLEQPSIYMVWNIIECIVTVSAQLAPTVEPHHQPRRYTSSARTPPSAASIAAPGLACAGGSSFAKVRVTPATVLEASASSALDLPISTADAGSGSGCGSCAPPGLPSPSSSAMSATSAKALASSESSAKFALQTKRAYYIVLHARAERDARGGGETCAATLAKAQNALTETAETGRDYLSRFVPLD